MKSLTVQELQSRVQAFSSEREWEQFHDPKNLTMALASEVGELSAILRWKTVAEADSAATAEPSRSAIIAELGDIGIVLLGLCNRLGIRFDNVVSEKLASNELRYPRAQSRGRAERDASSSGPATEIQS